MLCHTILDHETVLSEAGTPCPPSGKRGVSNLDKTPTQTLINLCSFSHPPPFFAILVPFAKANGTRIGGVGGRAVVRCGGREWRGELVGVVWGRWIGGVGGRASEV